MNPSMRLNAALRWDGERLTILDQTLLPHREEWITLETAADTADAIRRLEVRGAPLIGIAAGYGLAMEVAASSVAAAQAGMQSRREAPPTAVILAWVVDRVGDGLLSDGPEASPAGFERAETQLED